MTSAVMDYPGRVRIVVDDDQGKDQRGLIWSFRSRHYSSAPTAAMCYEAEALDALGGATAAAVAGASGGSVVAHGTLYPVWTSTLSTNIGGTSYMTHTGTNRVWARVGNQGTIPVDVRFRWDVGDLVNPVTNATVRVPAGTAYYMADLGEVRLDPSPVGTHRWQGQIDAKAVSEGFATTAFGIDRLFVLNADEGYGVLRAPVVEGATETNLAAFDSFEQSAGALSAASAPLGGNWDPGAAGASTAEDGDGDDFNLSGSPNFNVTRNPAGADSSLTNGRYIQLSGSSTIAAVEVQVDVSLPSVIKPGGGAEARGGVLARFVDTDNWLMAVRRHVHLTSGAGTWTYLSLYKRVAGTLTTLGHVVLSSGHQTGAFTVKLTVDAAGNYAVYTALVGSGLGAAKISGQDSALATGGALDDGKIGFYDASDLASAGVRTYDNFQASAPVTSTPASDAVIYANRTAQLTTQGMVRLDSTGTAYGPVSVVEGDLPRLPPESLEGRTTEIFVKASRGDLDQLPDSGIDDISAKVYYRPCWLFVP